MAASKTPKKTSPIDATLARIKKMNAPSATLLANANAPCATVTHTGKVCGMLGRAHNSIAPSPCTMTGCTGYTPPR